MSTKRQLRALLVLAMMVAIGGAAIWFARQSSPTKEAASLHLFSHARPKDYTGDAFAEALRNKLTGEEVSLVVNPLASTAEMDKLARSVIVGGTNDVQKARMLFDTLVTHFKTAPASFSRPATAREAFAALDAPGAAFGCQEFAFLYVSLARAAGLKAYKVWVDMDQQGMRLCHSCAGVFIGRRLLLVDVAYLSFGATHREFKVLDDVQTAALYACGCKEPQLHRIACKLAPDLPVVWSSLFHLSANEGRWDEAREEFGKLRKLDPEGPMTLDAEARLEVQAGRPDRAVETLRKATAVAPQTFQLHWLLGNVYARQARWSEAREAYQAALSCVIYEKDALAMRYSVAYMGALESLSKHDWEGTLTNSDNAIQLRPEFPEAYAPRAAARRVKGDLEGAASDCGKLVQLRPDLPESYFGRATVKQQRGI